MRHLLATATAFALLTASALGGDDYADRDARDAFSHELALCVAFYLVAAEAYRRHEESAYARAFTSVANRMLDRAAEIGDEKQVMLYAKHALHEFFRAAGADMSGMPALVEQYSASCALCYDYPDKVLQTWRENLAR
jgi:hypothetical protein